MKSKWLIAVMVVAGLMVGCGDEDEPTPTPDTSTAVP